MYRWYPCSSAPVFLSRVLVERELSVIDRSSHPRLGAKMTEGGSDGWFPEGTAVPLLPPHAALLRERSSEPRLVVPEPLTDLPVVWHELSEISCGAVQCGGSAVHHHSAPEYADAAAAPG